MKRGAESTSSPARRRDYERLRLEQELEWLRTLAHLSPIGLFRADAQGRCVYVNDRWCELTGRRADAAIGLPWEKVIHPEDVPRVREGWRVAEETRRPFRNEYRFLQPGGRIVWIFAQAVREVDGQGRTAGYLVTATEITELHRMREELQRSHAALEVRMHDRAAELQRMARIVESSDDAIISSDLEGNIVTWNPGAEKLFGYSAAEMIGQTTLVLTPEAKIGEAKQIKARVRAGEDLHHYETMRVARSGELLEVALSAFALRDPGGRITGTCGIIRDISARQRAERRLHQLSWRLLRMQDEERRRLARELHDTTAQTLAALCMNLTALSIAEAPSGDVRRAQLLADSLQLAESATAELRTTAYLLHPPLLDERGLPSALRWFIEGFAERSRIKVECDLSPDLGRFSAEVETTLFRVAQESLLNVHRHSGSPTVAIRLAREPGALLLEVRDHGRGLPPQDEELLGVGIAGMKERLLQLGGTLTIEPANPGTAVIARLPVTP